LPTALSAAQTAVLRIIADEAAAVQQFVDLLKVEQTALYNGSTDDLLEYAEQKSRLAVRLEALAAQRTSALAALGVASDRAGIDAWCAKHANEETAGNDWARILSLASEARELNRLNGELIQIRLQYNTKALEALQGGKSSLDLYGPDGQSTPPAHRRINDAV
jgi:flagella synthesis protein FlgN